MAAEEHYRFVEARHLGSAGINLGVRVPVVAWHGSRISPRALLCRRLDVAEVDMAALGGARHGWTWLSMAACRADMPGKGPKSADMPATMPGRSPRPRPCSPLPAAILAMLTLHAPAMPALADALLTILDRLWPARAKQELLLDLGEHKDWSTADRSAAVAKFAGWLTATASVPGTLAAAHDETDRAHDDLPDVPVDGVAPVGGVGRKMVARARLVGTPPKTLANTLTKPLRTDRRDHRWLILLRRLERGEVDTDAIVFHRRSPAAVAGAIARASGGRAPHAGDALLLLSLVALWQRRRDTHEARAARGLSSPRSAVPKPAAAVKWDVIALPQFAPLIELAVHRAGEFGRDLAAIAIEAVLTEAHLAPHRTRGARPPDAEWGASWLRSADDVLANVRIAALLGEQETAVFRWRVARMRDYAAGNRVVAVPVACQGHRYVDLALAIDAARGGDGCERRFASREPGYFMLLPQSRRRGLIEDA